MFLSISDLKAFRFISNAFPNNFDHSVEVYFGEVPVVAVKIGCIVKLHHHHV